MQIFKEIADKPNISYEELRKKYFLLNIDELFNKYSDALIIGENGSSKTFVLSDIGKTVLNAVTSFPGLHPFYCEVFVDSIINPNLQKEIEFVNCIWEDWGGNFLHPLGDDLLRAGKLNSILYCYMAAQTNTFDWLGHSLFMGHYDLVCRELRCILENIFFYFKLDFDSMTETVEEKYEKLRRLETRGEKLHGMPVFIDSGYADWERYYDLFSDLCAHIHISSNISGEHSLAIANGGFGEVLDIHYDEKLFRKCVDSWMQIVNLSGDLMKELFEEHGIMADEFYPAFFHDRYFAKGK